MRKRLAKGLSDGWTFQEDGTRAKAWKREGTYCMRKQEIGILAGENEWRVVNKVRYREGGRDQFI